MFSSSNANTHSHTGEKSMVLKCLSHNSNMLYFFQRTNWSKYIEYHLFVGNKSLSQQQSPPNWIEQVFFMRRFALMIITISGVLQTKIVYASKASAEMFRVVLVLNYLLTSVFAVRWWTRSTIRNRQCLWNPMNVFFFPSLWINTKDGMWNVDCIVYTIGNSRNRTTKRTIFLIIR